MRSRAEVTLRDAPKSGRSRRFDRKGAVVGASGAGETSGDSRPSRHHFRRLEPALQPTARTYGDGIIVHFGGRHGALHVAVEGCSTFGGLHASECSNDGWQTLTFDL